MNNTDYTGLNLSPDGWYHNRPNHGGLCESLIKADEFKDSSFLGCQYRLPVKNYMIAVNISISGRKSHSCGSFVCPYYKTRVKIEYVGDGEPSVFDHGFLYSKNPLI